MFKFNPFTGNFDQVSDDVTAAATASFTTIQAPSGTYPVATGSSDVLIFSSSDGSITIIGNSTTDTLDFKANTNRDYSQMFLLMGA